MENTIKIIEDDYDFLTVEVNGVITVYNKHDGYWTVEPDEETKKRIWKLIEPYERLLEENPDLVFHPEDDNDLDFIIF